MESDKMPRNTDEEPEKINEPKPERKVPEFIFVDEDYQEERQNLGATPQDPKQMFGSIQTITKGKHPLYLRILAFLGTIVMIFLSIVVLIVLLIVVLLSLLLLRQSKHMNEQASIAWKCFKKALVFTLGCFVCIFNLTLGIGIVLMYFMLTGEKMSSRFMQEFTKHQK